MQPLANERDGILPPALTEQTGSGPGRPHWDVTSPLLFV